MLKYFSCHYQDNVKPLIFTIQCLDRFLCSIDSFDYYLFSSFTCFG